MGSYSVLVPKGLKRYYGGGDFHFITCSCYHRKPWLNSARHRDLFLSILEEVRQRCRFVVLGYVVDLIPRIGTKLNMIFLEGKGKSVCPRAGRGV
jgi:hypothetical protein